MRFDELPVVTKLVYPKRRNHSRVCQSSMPGKFRFAIDRGGTFTDVYAECPNGRFHTLKLLSVDPENYSDAPREGIRRILEQETGVKVPKNERIDGSNIEWIRMGTTIATNALLERKGERMALVINRGFKDLLHIGNQARPDIFDLEITVPEVLYEEVVEVDCRIIPEMADRCALPEAKSWPVLSGLSDERYLYCTPLNEDNLRTQLKSVLARGIKSIAVVLMHSYMYHEHEIIIGQLAAKLGFTNVSLSHQVMPMVKIVSRGFTASTDAYLTPHIKKYVKGFASGFVNDLDGVNVLFMQSDGGLTPMHKFNGSRAILSGPAGGVVGYATTTPGTNPVIGFDMGGTSTDVSRFDGSYEHVFETTVAGVTIQSPQLDINTVAAGGGSRLFFRSGLFVVGPESAGAHPGPVCYRKGGYLTITDANLVLGRIVPDYFPKIFGPDEKQPLDKETTVKKFEELRDEINEFLQSQNGNAELLSVEKVAMGFIRVANEAMCRPIRALTQGKGYDVTKHTLACFGGAGGQHACAIARELGISQVAIHKYAGILSAYGMACADVVHEEQEPCSLVFSSENFPSLEAKISALQKTCAQKLEELGFSKRNIVCEPFLNLRYDGTDNCLMCSSADDAKTLEGFKNAFINRYQKEYGFTMKERKILVDDVRVRGIGKSARISENSSTPERSEPSFDKVVSIYFDKYGFVASNVYLSERLKSGQMIKGPALIMDGLSTTLIEPDSEASVTSTGNLLIDVDTVVSSRIGTDLDTIQLSIFSHRFMSIAEQMGRVLQRTAISTNIKERLDFSCALFGPDGGVVSNAPHIPVHLGSMQEAVQFQMTSLGGEIREGDVILSNHPQAGGTHLPDLTVITPVFYNGTSRPVFFVASRGHHADIGGITPGSMPPHSKSLDQEGATFKSFFLVRDGVFREKDVIDELMKPGDIPGSSGTRNLQDNLADLKAQIAANQKGINLVKDLIDHYGLDVVQAYMSHIQQNASVAVQNVLKTIGKQELDKQGKSELFCSDFMDDGSPICLRIAINIDNGNAVFDFTGSGFEVWGNCNAPKAITMSAIIYCLRCIVGQNIPLNQGCLAPIKTIIPVGSILNPSPGAAVVGGNVQTSQRIVDVILKAFKACADSQGCMNNVTFGQKDWGYYETIAGGGGAGPTWNGRSGIHTHMTNTRITDPEILEKRYPVVLEAFKLRENSGGEGEFKGGDGIERKLKFRNHIALSILTERRVFSPCGLNGGSNGAKGINLMHKTDGRIIYLASKTAIDAEPGDSLQVLTPGGGGWGAAKGQEDFSDSKIKNKKTSTPKFFEKGSLADFSKAQYSA